MTETEGQKPALEHTTARELTRAEIDEFLSGVLLARLATAKDNRPQVTPVWYEWDGEYLWVTMDRGSRKYRNLRANPYCAVTIDETLGGLRFKAVIMEGPVELITEPKEWVLEKVKHIYTRYLGKEGILADTPQAMLRDGDHVVARIKPERIISWDDTNGVAPIG